MSGLVGTNPGHLGNGFSTLLQPFHFVYPKFMLAWGLTYME